MGELCVGVEVMAFLDELERVRGITARTRNLRLTAVHSFFRFAAFEAPTHAAHIQRVLAIPAKRFRRTLLPFLNRQEVDALLAAPDQRTWSGRRDHALLLLAVQTEPKYRRLSSRKCGPERQNDRAIAGVARNFEQHRVIFTTVNDVHRPNAPRHHLECRAQSRFVSGGQAPRRRRQGGPVLIQIAARILDRLGIKLDSAAAGAPADSPHQPRQEFLQTQKTLERAFAPIKDKFALSMPEAAQAGAGDCLADPPLRPDP